MSKLILKMTLTHILLAISRQKTGFCLVNRSEAWFLADNSLKMCGDMIFEMSLSLVSQIKVLG